MMLECRENVVFGFGGNIADGRTEQEVNCLHLSMPPCQLFFGSALAFSLLIHLCRVADVSSPRCWNRQIFLGDSMSFHGFLYDSMPMPLVGSRRFLWSNHTGLFVSCFQKILFFYHVYILMSQSPPRYFRIDTLSPSASTLVTPVPMWLLCALIFEPQMIDLSSCPLRPPSEMTDMTTCFLPDVRAEMTNVSSCSFDNPCRDGVSSCPWIPPGYLLDMKCGSREFML